MAAKNVLFARRYRAALLDYLLGSRETALARAYDLGRAALDDGLGPLQILQAHHKAVRAVLEPRPNPAESLRKLNATDTFLMETLSPFEMTYRGYLALLDGDRGEPGEPGVRRRGRRR